MKWYNRHKILPSRERPEVDEYLRLLEAKGFTYSECHDQDHYGENGVRIKLQKDNVTSISFIPYGNYIDNTDLIIAIEASAINIDRVSKGETNG